MIRNNNWRAVVWDFLHHDKAGRHGNVSVRADVLYTYSQPLVTAPREIITPAGGNVDCCLLSWHRHSKTSTRHLSHVRSCAYHMVLWPVYGNMDTAQIERFLYGSYDVFRQYAILEVEIPQLEVPRIRGRIPETLVFLFTPGCRNIGHGVSNIAGASTVGEKSCYSNLPATLANMGINPGEVLRLTWKKPSKGGAKLEGVVHRKPRSVFSSRETPFLPVGEAYPW